MTVTSFETGEMTFSRNTGDFIRILRVCYSKPNETDEPVQTLEEDLCEMKPPPPPPIYLQCKNIISTNNSVRELKRELNEFMAKENWKSQTDLRRRWNFLIAESITVFTSDTGGKNNSFQSRSSAKGSNSGKHKKINKYSIDYDNSFHAISISSSGMNCSMFNAIHVFYDGGYFEQVPTTNTEDESQLVVGRKSKTNHLSATIRSNCTIL